MDRPAWKAASSPIARTIACRCSIKDGRLLGAWLTKLIGPAVMYVDDDDIVYIVEHNAGLVSVLTLDGERLAQWGDPAFKSCHGVSVYSHGDLYVVRGGAWA